MARQYTTKGGFQKWKPSQEELEEIIGADNNEGFCMDCGAWNEGIEPDARRVKCDACGEMDVWGAEELLLHGLYDRSKED